MSKMTLWGFDGSTYVRTVKMVLAEKQFTDFERVLNNQDRALCPDDRRHPGIHATLKEFGRGRSSIRLNRNFDDEDRTFAMMQTDTDLVTKQIRQALHDGDRVEIYRRLTVDPKVARRERFTKQGAKKAGLFTKRRAGAGAGY